MKKVFQFAKAVFEKVTSIKWASKLLALVLSMLLLTLVCYISLIFVLGTYYRITENLAYYTELVIFLLIAILIVGFAAILLPLLRDYVQRFLTVGPGKKILLWTIPILWFTLLFNQAMFERPRKIEIAVTVILTGLLLWIVATSVFLSSKGRIQILSAIAAYVCIMIFYSGIYNLLFLNRPVSFVFSPNIVTGSELKNEFQESLDGLRQIEYQLFIATLIEENYQESFLSADDLFSGKTSARQITSNLSIKFVWLPDPPGGPELHLLGIYYDREIYLTIRGNWVRHPEKEIVYDALYSDTAQEVYEKFKAFLMWMESKS